MPELTSSENALTRLNALFDVPDKYQQDYANIAWLLTDGDAFKTELATVSELLWRSYSGLSVKMANKFFQALRLVAKNEGFYFDSTKQSVTDLVTLFSAISAEDYLGWIAKGVFFKDAMDLKHGEHSHSFQWLAISIWGKKNNNLTNDAAELYRNIYQMRPKRAPIIVPGFKLRPKESGQGPRKDVSLWSWLVDCFPSDMAQGQTLPEGDSLFSDTFRSPQYVTKYLVDEADEDTNFLACYLKSRYRAHRWFKQDWVDPQKQKKTRVYADYAHIAGGATSKNLAYKKDDSDMWMPIGSDKHSPGGYVRASNDARGVLTQEEIDAKKLLRVDKTFHNHTGKMIVHA